eukprot:gene25546-32016_t
MRRLGESCTLGTSCVSGSCVGGVCSDANKICPNNCFANGVCQFTSSSGLLLSNCSLIDPTCSAQCVCDSDSFGIDCSLTASAFAITVQLRETVCSGIHGAASLQDLSADVISSRAITIANALQDPTLISHNALLNCSSLLIGTVQDNPTLICQNSVVSSLLMTSLSKLLALKAALPSIIIDSVSAALSTLSESCQATLAAGEAPFTFITDNARLSASLSDFGGVESIAYSAPQSDFEVFNRVPPPL